MTLSYFTLIHVLISLMGIFAGFGVLSGLLAAKLFPRWTDVFLATTIATSVTGLMFPIRGFTPGIALAIISLVALSVASYGLYIRRLAGAWRKLFVINSVLALYLNVFVLVVQLFQKMPVLKEIAPTQTEPPFAITQALVLMTFIAMGILATKRFR